MEKGLTARAVGVEDARDAHVDVILVVESVCQGLGNALAFIVACPRTNGVDVAPATRREDIDQSVKFVRC